MDRNKTSYTLWVLLVNLMVCTGRWACDYSSERGPFYFPQFFNPPSTSLKAVWKLCLWDTLFQQWVDTWRSVSTRLMNLYSTSLYTWASCLGQWGQLFSWVWQCRSFSFRIYCCTERRQPDFYRWSVFNYVVCFRSKCWKYFFFLK